MSGALAAYLDGLNRPQQQVIAWLADPSCRDGREFDAKMSTRLAISGQPARAVIADFRPAELPWATNDRELLMVWLRLMHSHAAHTATSMHCDQPWMWQVPEEEAE